jgi:putative flippase GtrA
MVKFGIAGGVATIADCSVLWFLLAIFGAKRISFWGLNTESYLIYNTISYTVGATVSYVLSIKCIFPYRNIKNRHLEFFVFLVIAFGGWALTSLIIHLGMRLIQTSTVFQIIKSQHTIASSISLTPRELAVMLVKGVAIVLVFFYNFGVRKVVMFSGPR